jgi:tetratricopeptide (TPR) repeat protein
MTEQRLDRLLQKCTVRLNVAGRQGTGFFVAPGLVLTCAHVLGQFGSESIQVFWKETQQEYDAKIKGIIENPNIDIALLSLIGNIQEHPCVYFDLLDPLIGHNLYAFGYPVDYSETYSGGESVTLEYEGDSFKDNALFLKLKEGQIKEGSSGSPLLNLISGGVCGIVAISRPNALGGRAIPVKVIFREFPILKKLNNEFHEQDNRWCNLLPEKANKLLEQADEINYQNLLLDYRLRSEEFIHESYARSENIDFRCEETLKELRETLGLSSEQTQLIENEIIHDYLNANKKLEKNINRYQRHIIGATENKSLLSDEDRELIKERQKAIGIENESAGITFSLLGNELIKQGDLIKASTYFKESIRLNGDDPSAYVGLGTILYRQGHIDEAMKIFDMAENLYRLQPKLTKQHKELKRLIQYISKKRKRNIIVIFLERFLK